MKDNYIEKVLNENLLQDDFGKVYFLSEEAAIDFAESYHLSKCSNNAPIGYVREWEGDVSDANNFIFVEKLDELDDSPNWVPVFAYPQPSDADAKLSESSIIEAIKDGYKLSYNEPVDYLTDEANLKTAWFVERSKAPFRDKEGMGIWLGATPLEALTKCKNQLTKDKS